MNTEIITIGDEILIGHILNRNAQWMANHLTENGFLIQRITTIPDKISIITDCLEKASDRSDFVFITGGLGPTNDDVTKKAISRFFNVEWNKDEQVYNRIIEFLKERGYSMSHPNEAQAKVPDNSKIYMNYIGTAPGFLLKKDNTHFVFMPGVHFEMKKMMEDSIVPELKKQYIKKELINQVIITQGVPEAHLAEILKDWERDLSDRFRIAYLPSPGIVKVRISGESDDGENVREILQQKIRELKKLIPEYFVVAENTTMEKLIGKMLTEGKYTLATAESCTGGGIASAITSVPGSSEYFKGSVVAYSDEIKENLLRIDPETIKQYGAVSKQVTERMAQNIIKLYNTDFSIAVSGIAGPSGGTPEKPVGTTWITVASKNNMISEKYLFGTKRDVNIVKTINTSLNLLRKMIIKKN